MKSGGLAPPILAALFTSVAAALAATATAATAPAAIRLGATRQAPNARATRSPAGPEHDLFEEVSAATGLDFVHFNGMSGRYYFPEVMGSGGALVDVDGDGDLDVFLVQGTMLGPGLTPEDALFPPPPGAPAGDRLYRNDLRRDAAGVPHVTFTDVSVESGVASVGYGMGVAAADYDNDGRVDLYVTRLGSNRLLHNEGGGKFRDATAESGAGGGDDWSVSAAFADFDGDGWLDLAVANYVVFSYLEHKVCLSKRGERGYCLPTSFRPSSARLYRNRGDGSFEEVSAPAGIAALPGNGLGILAADFDDDGHQDLFVANDLIANRLWIQRATVSVGATAATAGAAPAGGTLAFADQALLAGCALDGEGHAGASMGIDYADFDGDGDDDLFITKFDGETDTLYRNDGHGQFLDVTAGSGIGQPSFRLTGFGARFLDYDNDGRLDLAITNGRVIFRPGADLALDPYPMAEPNLLFHNDGDGAFSDQSAMAGAAFTAPMVGRGLAIGDVDDDGDVDLLITASSGRARLFLNRVGDRRSWLGLRLVVAGGAVRGREGATSTAASTAVARDALGAVVTATLRSGRELRRRVAADGSYASASDPRIVLGLGDGDAVTGLRVQWPDGRVERFDPPPVGVYTTLRRGSGRTP